ncbi:MAG: hypothetical protein P4L77_11965 [Sulfuriferula sp.]|nr:hypothetical protein [Sulfuriferula sp.]
MPEVNHKDQPSIPVTAAIKAAAPAPVVEAAPIPAAKPTVTEDPSVKLAKALSDAGITNETLEQQIEAILKRKKVERKEALTPKEPDWSKITEAEAYKPDVYIPVIEHDIPDYMNIELKDNEYEAVWASRDQRRLGQLQAEGYEFIQKEHFAAGFHIPLIFDSEGLYLYQDVVAMRVHKRILYGKRRRALEISLNQLKRRGADARIKAKLSKLIAEDPFLERALDSERMGFYDTDAA